MAKEKPKYESLVKLFTTLGHPVGSSVSHDFIVLERPDAAQGTHHRSQLPVKFTLSAAQVAEIEATCLTDEVALVMVERLTRTGSFPDPERDRITALEEQNKMLAESNALLKKRMDAMESTKTAEETELQAAEAAQRAEDEAVKKAAADNLSASLKPTKKGKGATTEPEPAKIE